MSEVEELESRIRSLPVEDFATFREWFLEYEDSMTTGDATQVNRCEAKNQFSKPVKTAVAEEDVKGLRDFGCLAGQLPNIDVAFSDQVDAEVTELFTSA